MAHSTTNSESRRSILLVEDDVRLASRMSEYLQAFAFDVEVEHRGDAAVARIVTCQPHLTVLDLMLPGLDGLEVCRRVRPHYREPILMLTARDDDIEQVVGLEVGADDYVSKPVEPRILLARIRALLRHAERVRADNHADIHTNSGGSAMGVRQELTFGKLHISRATHSVELDGKPADLTAVEFELLWLLASHAGKTLGREFVFGELSGKEYDGLDRSIDIRISRLRKKLGDDGARPMRIKTVRGQGYLFVADAWS